jgi:hypothetical protein
LKDSIGWDVIASLIGEVESAVEAAHGSYTEQGQQLALTRGTWQESGSVVGQELDGFWEKAPGHMSDQAFQNLPTNVGSDADTAADFGRPPCYAAFRQTLDC